MFKIQTRDAFNNQGLDEIDLQCMREALTMKNAMVSVNQPRRKQQMARCPQARRDRSKMVAVPSK